MARVKQTQSNGTSQNGLSIAGKVSMTKRYLECGEDLTKAQQQIMNLQQMLAANKSSYEAEDRLKLNHQQCASDLSKQIEVTLNLQLKLSDLMLSNAQLKAENEALRVASKRSTDEESSLQLRMAEDIKKLIDQLNMTQEKLDQYYWLYNYTKDEAKKLCDIMEAMLPRIIKAQGEHE